MNRPSVLAKVVRGLSIAAASGFADTFNWIASCMSSIKGDRQVSPGTGYVEVDGLDVGEPVVRFKARLDGKSLSETQGSEENKIWEVKGFESASDGQVPVKREDGIAWEAQGGGSSIKFIGTDGSWAIAGDPEASSFKTVMFLSEIDSNVTVKASGSGGDVRLKIGVYWK